MKNSKERYEDYRSTAALLIPFGIIGIIYSITDYFNITAFMDRVSFISNLFQFIISMLLFVIFLGVGVSSLATSKKIKSTIADEEDMVTKINNYLKDTLTDDYIKLVTSAEDSRENDGEKYYAVMESITADIKENFPDADDELISETAENFYNENF